MLIGRRWVLGGLLAGAALPTWAQAPAVSLRPRARPTPRPLVTSADAGAAAGGDFRH